MNTDNPLTTLFRHNRWANMRLFQQCATLSDEQLDSTLLGTFGSIRDTLVHITLAEQSYLSRIRTGQRYNWPDDAPLTLAELTEMIQESGAHLIEWAGKVQADDTVEIDWDGELRQVPKTILLTQAINHATEHRTQIMAILTQLGIEPLSSDGWTYFAEGF